jgi:hypothetical protein
MWSVCDLGQLLFRDYTYRKTRCNGRPIDSLAAHISDAIRALSSPSCMAAETGATWIATKQRLFVTRMRRP